MTQEQMNNLLQYYSFLKTNIINAGFLWQGDQAQPNPIGDTVSIKQNGVELYPLLTNNQEYCYIFDYPLKIGDPNGVYLLKLSQIQLNYKDKTFIPFFNDIQFARVFALIYMVQYHGLQMNINDLAIALSMFIFKYHFVQPKAIMLSENVFQYEDDVGSIRQHCFNLYKRYEVSYAQKFLQLMFNLNNQTNSYYTSVEGQRQGYTIPDQCIQEMCLTQYQIYSLLYKLKQEGKEQEFSNICLYINQTNLNLIDDTIINSDIEINNYINIDNSQTVQAVQQVDIPEIGVWSNYNVGQEEQTTITDEHQGVINGGTQQLIQTSNDVPEDAQTIFIVDTNKLQTDLDYLLQQAKQILKVAGQNFENALERGDYRNLYDIAYNYVQWAEDQYQLTDLQKFWYYGVVFILANQDEIDTELAYDVLWIISTIGLVKAGKTAEDAIIQVIIGMQKFNTYTLKDKWQDFYRKNNYSLFEPAKAFITDAILDKSDYNNTVAEKTFDATLEYIQNQSQYDQMQQYVETFISLYNITFFHDLINNTQSDNSDQEEESQQKIDTNTGYIEPGQLYTVGYTQYSDFSTNGYYSKLVFDQNVLKVVIVDEYDNQPYGFPEVIIASGENFMFLRLDGDQHVLQVLDSNQNVLFQTETPSLSGQCYGDCINPQFASGNIDPNFNLQAPVLRNYNDITVGTTGDTLLPEFSIQVDGTGSLWSALYGAR